MINSKKFKSDEFITALNVGEFEMLEWILVLGHNAEHGRTSAAWMESTAGLAILGISVQGTRE